MSALAHGRAPHPELQAFAQGVIDAQAREIAQMRRWAMDCGFDPMPTSHGDTPMPGLPNTGAGGAAAANARPIIATVSLALATIAAGMLVRRARPAAC